MRSLSAFGCAAGCAETTDAGGSLAHDAPFLHPM